MCRCQHFRINWFIRNWTNLLQIWSQLHLSNAFCHLFKIKVFVPHDIPFVTLCNLDPWLRRPATARHPCECYLTRFMDTRCFSLPKVSLCSFQLLLWSKVILEPTKLRPNLITGLVGIENFHRAAKSCNLPLISHFRYSFNEYCKKKFQRRPPQQTKRVQSDFSNKHEALLNEGTGKLSLPELYLIFLQARC